MNTHTAILLALVACLSLPLASPVRAQASGEQVAEGRAMVEAGRRELVSGELMLSDRESAAFWPVYDEYRAAAEEIANRYTAMIMSYVDRYDAGELDDEYADALLDEYFAVRQEMLDLRRAYVPRFEAVLPMLKVAQFYQLENKINAEIDARLAQAIPLISE